MAKRLFHSLGDQLFETLKDQIVSNELEPGEMLQIERLASEFDVSTTPVREALTRLQSLGLVNQIRNKGAVVTPISEKIAHDTWEFRRVLELFVVESAALNCKKEEINKLRDLLERVLADTSDFDLYKKSDRDMHMLLHKYCNNDLINKAFEQVSDLAQRVRYFAESSPWRTEVILSVTNEHLKILDAIEKRDVEMTKSHLLQHLLNAEKRTMKALGKLKEEIPQK
jgi:DNA-binding GntR family transcriptional regulator